MVGFALGKTPGGEHLLHYWKSIGQEKQDALLDGINDAVYNLIANKVTEDDDDDLFGGSSNHPHGKEIAQELDLWLRRRQSSSRRPIIPSSEKYVQEVIAAFNKSFLKGIETWAEYPLYGNTDVKYDIREYFENSRGVNFMDYVDQVNESEDDDLFSKPGAVATGIKQSIKQIQNPYQRTVSRVRDIAKDQFGVKVRVSAQPATAARGTATFWFGDYITGPRGRAPKAEPVAHEIKAELERRGFECKFTGSEWLSVRVPPAFSDILDESEDDDDLFASPTKRFVDFFNEYDEDRLQAMGFSYGEDDPETDADIINHYLEDGPVNWRVVKLTGTGDDIVLHLDRSSRLGENDESDDDLFGVSGSAAQRMIYKFGKQMLAKLEQAYNNPRIKAEYEKLIQGEEPDANRLFDLVCRSTSTPFGKAIVVDAILREYAEQFNGLNDFGTLIDSGEWHQEMVEMWDMFGNDPDVAQQDWFQKEIQTFMGDR
jgi:hypothetical protein